MQFLWALVAKRYNNIMNNNIILCIYINKGLPSTYSNQMVQSENLAPHEVFGSIIRLKAP